MLLVPAILCVQVAISAGERSSKAFRFKTSRNGGRLTHEAAPSFMEQAASAGNCTEAPSLRTVLLKLGLAPEELAGQHCDWPGVSCYFCNAAKIHLSNKGLTGELPKELASLEWLEELDLSFNPHLRGDLQPLVGLRDIYYVNLQHTNVSGSLQLLQSAHRMRLSDLRLSGTRISGSFGGLRHLLRPLRHLELKNTNVAGGFEDLRSAVALKTLDLSKTAVNGDLAELRKVKRLEYLALSGTQVTGDIQSLEAMDQLHELDLSENAGINGSISSLVKLSEVEMVNLADTEVSGHFSPSWNGHLQKLRVLDLAGTRTTLLPEANDPTEDHRYVSRYNDFVLPALVQLDVSRCPLNSAAGTMMWLLSGCRSLARISAAASNITGILPADTITSHLATSLQYLDLSQNRLSKIEGLHAGTLLSLAGNPPLKFSSGILRKAKRRRVHMDLVGVDFRNARDHARELLNRGDVKKTEATESTSAEGGFACHGLQDGFLQVTPALFLPQVLCGCLPGWQGTGIECSPCGRGEYNSNFNATRCTACPFGSDTNGEAAALLESCQCQVGRIFTKSGQSRCECEPHTALFRDKCVDCNELHLECHGSGSRAETAPPRAGFARLLPGLPKALRCFDQIGDCNASVANSSELGCAPGYEGPLCSICAEGYRRAGIRCKQCAEGTETLRWPLVAAGAAVAVGACGFVAWRHSQRSRAGEDASAPAKALTATAALWPLLLAQGPVLLQLGQLWGVLVALGDTTTQSKGHDRSPGIWEQEYVQWLQFTASGVRDALSLECAYGRSARSLGALSAPCVPLLVLLLCAFVEAVEQGAGVSLALKALSLLFIGGASSCAKLLHCQMVDGGGEPLYPYAFRSELPHAWCSDSRGEAGWADIIGRACAVSYLFLIPAFLVYLIMKQYLLLAPSKRIASFAECKRDETVLRVGEMKPPGDVAEKSYEDPNGKLQSLHLLASAVAFSAVFFRGQLRLQLKDAGVSVQRVHRDQRESVNEMEFDADTMMSSVLERKADADLQRCQTITRMLVERHLVEEAGKSDRIVAGAKELFFKYAACREVWVEVALKLVAVALVAVAATYQSLFLTLFLTLGSAVGLGTLKPYRQRQVNDLQCLCFLCLSVAAVGFSCARPWLARGALAAPFAVAAAQALRPDGPEALALRLWEAAQADWPTLQQGKSVELSVDTVSFL